MRDSSNVPEQEGMVLHLADGSIQACNANAESILGVNAEQMQEWISLDRSFTAIALDGSPVLSEMHPAMVALRTGKPCLGVTMGFYRPNTDLIWLSLNSQPLFRSNETIPYAVVTTFWDITEQKQELNISDTLSVQNQQQLIAQMVNERFALAAAAVNCLIYDWDLASNTVERICGLSEILGYQPQEAEPTAQWWNDRIYPEDLQKINENDFWEHIAQNDRYCAEYRVRHQDGHYLWVQDRQIVIRNDSGKPIRIVGSTTDISERKRTEIQLQKSIERLRIAQRAANAGWWNGDILAGRASCSEEYFELHGLDANVPHSYENWLACIVEEDRERADREVRQALEQRSEINIEFRVQHPIRGRRWLNAIGNTFYNSEGEAVQMAGITLDISDRKQVEETLNANMAILSAVNEATTTLIFAKDRQGRMWMANPATIRTIGKPEAEILGHTDLDFLSDRLEAERIMENDRLVMETAQVEVFEEKIQFPEGIRTYLSTKSPYRNKQGNIIGLIGVSTDISDRKQTEANLQESEERLRLATTWTDLGMWFWYLPTNELIWTDKCKELFGIAPDTQMSYDLFLNSLHPDDRDRTDEAVTCALEDKVDYDIEYRTVWSDGSVHWIAAKGRSFYDPEGNAVKMMGTAQDITERKQAEVEREQILARSQQYASQLQGLTEAALAINAALSIKEVLQLITEQGRLIIGTHQAIASITLNQNWAQAIHSIYLSDKYAAWRDYSEQLDGTGIYSEVCQTNRPMRMTQKELEAHRRWRGLDKAADKHPPLRGLLVAPLVGQDGGNMGLIQLSDKYEGEFTEEDEAIAVQLAQMASIAVENVRLYEAEQNARSQAEAANRVKDEFLAILSHELRSPLNPILGWTQLLQTYQLDADKINQALTTIERNAKLLTQLIDDLLDIARILRGKLRLKVTPLNLDLAIKAAIETVSTAAAAKSISIETNLSPVGQVRGDFARLQQIIWNLLSNALKFTPDGGRVEIQLKQIGDRVQLSVSDTGKGIAPEFLPHVFEYFRQADASVTRNHGGLGLGLAIVRHLVELHGGEVAVTSPGEGQGATFVVQLPLLSERNSEAEAQKGEEELEPDLPNLKGIRVLVVDDDLDNREFLAIMLKQYQAEVMAVASAIEVSSVLRTFKPDILVSDIGMPEIDGYTLLRSIRCLPPKQGGQIPAIAVTAYARAEDRSSALASGFQRHLSKPIEANELVIAIAELLRH
jgi:PAS domain S-box-containing protein